MTLRTDPAALDQLAGDLERSTEPLGTAKAAPEADAGPSSAAISATLAELMRAAAGLVETTSTTAENVHRSAHTYASTDQSNAGQINQIQLPH